MMFHFLCLAEAYNQLERSGKIIEKPIFVETVKNITTVKEVPAKIEERTIYVQDTAELERLHAIIRELEQEIIKLNDEKQILQAVNYKQNKNHAAYWVFLQYIVSFFLNDFFEGILR